MTISRSTPIAEIELPAEVHDLLRRWCSYAVTVDDFDQARVRQMFASLIPCKERTVGIRLYKKFGLAPLELGSDKTDDGDGAGCLYLRGTLSAVQAELTAIYRHHGLAPMGNVTSADMGSHAVHRTPRTSWESDVLVVVNDSQWIAVGSREWELSFPGSNALAAELSRAFPVLALTKCEAFTEVGVYRDGQAVQTWVPRGKKAFRLAGFRSRPSRAFLVGVLGEDPRWDDLDDLGPVIPALGRSGP